MTRTSIIALTLALAAACVEKDDDAMAVDMEQIKSLVSTRAPTPRHTLDVAFEGKVTLIGYDTDVTEIVPGKPFEITWYWKSEKPLEEGWLLFTHVADARAQNRLNADLFGPVRNAYPPARWKAGEFIKDTQTITLPTDWNSPGASFLLGFWNGPHRLQVTRGKADGENRAQVLTLQVAGAPEPERAITLPAKKVTGAITIDGKLDEVDWGAAIASTPFLNPMTGAIGSFAAKVRVLFDDERIYLGYEVSDTLLKSTFTNADDHLWEQDAIEVMLDPDGDGKNYFEVQVSPAGLVFDTRYDTVRQPRPFGDINWSSRASAKVTVSGTLNDSAADQGYVVEMSMPWKAFAVGPTPATPPAEGTAWRVNFYVMDAQRDGQRAVAWSAPRVPDFHTPARFGSVVFGLPPVVPAVMGDAPADGTAPPLPSSVPVVTPAAAQPTPASQNLPPQPREVGAGRTEIKLSPAEADAIRERAKLGQESTTPPTVHAH